MKAFSPFKFCLWALALLAPLVAVAQPEILTRDGFPTDYQNQDFTPTAAPASPTISPGTGVAPHLDALEANDQAEAALQKQRAAAKQQLAHPTRAASHAGGQVVGRSFAIDELPHTSGSTGPGRLKTTAAATSVTAPGEVVAPSLTLPQPALPATNDLPTDAAALASWGPLTATAAGLTETPADTLWAGVDFPAIQGVLAQIEKSPPASAALKTALVRLLLVQAMPPKNAGLAWLVTRAHTLTAIGRDEAALQLLRAVPTGVLTGPDAADPVHQQLAQGWLAAQLVSGETQNACAVAKQRMAIADLPVAAKTQGQQAVAVCQEFAGDTKGATLSWQLAGTAVDPFLLKVKDAWEHRQPLRNEPFFTTLHALNPFAVALLAARPALLLATPQLVPKLPQIALRRIMNTPGLPVTLRLAAAENLAASEAGGNAVLDGEEAAPTDLSHNPDAAAVAALYQALPFAPAIQQDPLGAAGFLTARNAVNDREQARALLWQTAARQQANAPVSLRALAWQRWHDQVLQSGVGGLLSGLTVNQATIKPEDSIAWLAPMSLAGTWRQGSPAAPAWLNVMTSSTVLAPHLPLLRLTNSVLADDQPDAALWSAGLQGGSSLQNNADSTRLLAVAQALGLAPPAEAVQAAWLHGSSQTESTVSAAPSPLWQDAVSAALQQKQAGLVILLLTQPQAGEDPAATGWLQVRLRALRTMGLESLAKKLAGEALALPLATLTEAVEPAPPALNNGHAPSAGSKEIGGPINEALPTLQATPAGDDGLLLPPPRVQPTFHKPTIKKPTVNKLGKLPLTPSTPAQ